MRSTSIVAISDTHDLHNYIDIPDGDILVHAGDLTNRGNLCELPSFNKFLGKLPHKHKIVIAGNHDWCFQDEHEGSKKLLSNCIYLRDEEVVIQGIRFYGSPWQPWFCDWAFNLQRGEEIREKWDMIPKGIDVLITHGPPYGYCDTVEQGGNVGCSDLADVVNIIKPQVHIFGHIHEAYGTCVGSQIEFINASICDLGYNPTNKPIITTVRRKEGENE
jgi:Icc-related predicted phosphoesterase